MAISSLLRSKPLYKNRIFSSISVADFQSSITNKQKIETALTLFKTKKNNPAEQILYLCLSNTLSALPHDESSSPIHNFVHEMYSQPSLLHSFIEELKTQPNFQKERFFSSFITVYGQAGMFDHAIKTFEEMPTKGIKPSGESLNALLTAGLCSDRLHEVNVILNDFPRIYGTWVPVDSYNKILKAYIPWGYYRYRAEISNLLQKMDSEGCEPNASTYMVILAGIYKEGPSEALSVIQFLLERKVPLSVEIYNFAITTLFQMKRSDEAYGLYLKFCNWGVKPNADTYQHLIRGFGEEGYLKMTRLLYQDMTSMGVVPDRYCYETLMEYLCKFRYYDTAFEVCKNCLSEKWFPFVFFTVPTMNKLVDGLVETSKHEDLIEMMERKGLRPGHDLYNLAIARLCNLNRTAEAKALCGRMIFSGKKPNSSTCDILFSGLEDNEDLVGMTQLYMELNEQCIEVSTRSFKILIRCLVKKGRWEDFETAWQACRDCIPKEWFSDFFNSNPLIMNTLLDGLARSSKHDEFKKVVEMLEDHGLQPNLYSYSSMINHMCREKKSAEAMELFERVSSKGMKFQSDTYKNLFRLFGEEKNVGMIKRLYNDTHEKTVELHSYCYRTLIKKLSQSGDFDTALCVWKDYRSKKSSSETLLDLYSNHISALCRQKEVSDAKALFEGVVLRGMVPDEYAFRNLIYEYCLAENVEDVKGIFHVIREKGLLDERYCNKDVIKLISRVGDSETSKWAKEFLETRAFDIDLVLSEDIPRMREILNSFLGVPVVQGMNNDAMKMEERSTKTADWWKEIRKSYEEMGLNPECVNLACCLLSFGICYRLGALVF